jgi:hypothetical protein
MTFHLATTVADVLAPALSGAALVAVDDEEVRLAVAA